MKRCAKCDGPIPVPVLVGQDDERCPLCGDEPATRADLAPLLREALRGVSAIHRYLGDVEAGSWEEEAWTALDRALDEIDGATRTLESEDDEWADR